MLAGIASRVYTGVAGSAAVVQSSFAAPTSAANALWTWWDERPAVSGEALQASMRSVASNASITTAAVGRIATAVTAQATKRQVARLSTAASQNRGATASATPTAADTADTVGATTAPVQVAVTPPQPSRRSPCRQWSLFCRRRPNSNARSAQVRHMTGTPSSSASATPAAATATATATAATASTSSSTSSSLSMLGLFVSSFSSPPASSAPSSTPSTFTALCRRLWSTDRNDSTATADDGGAGSSSRSAATATSTSTVPSFPSSSSSSSSSSAKAWRESDAAAPSTFVVYLKKRKLAGTDWADTLTWLGQDHVGVVIAPYDKVSQCGGRLPLTLPSPDSGVPQTAFDFGPVCGKDFSIFHIMDAEIRQDMFDEGETAFVAASSRTWEEVEQFNKEYKHKYVLGHSDCRDYATAFVEFMTGVTIAPAATTAYISNHQSAAASSAARDVDVHHHSAPSSDCASASFHALPSHPAAWCFALGL